MKTKAKTKKWVAVMMVDGSWVELARFATEQQAQDHADKMSDLQQNLLPTKVKKLDR